MLNLALLSASAAICDVPILSDPSASETEISVNLVAFFRSDCDQIVRGTVWKLFSDDYPGLFLGHEHLNMSRSHCASLSRM